jgi:Zn-dependent protease
MPPSPAAWAAANLVHSIQLNAVLCVFNMLPLPPLDGGRVAVGLLPRSLALPLARLEPYGIPILLLLLFILPYLGAQTGLDLDIAGGLIGAPTNALIRFVLAITGQGE